MKIDEQKQLNLIAKEEKVIDLFNLKSKEDKDYFSFYNIDNEEVDILCPILNNNEMSEYIPEEDEDYVFEKRILRAMLCGYKSGTPVYLQGAPGVGKTTLIEQFCAKINTPYLRVQHTANTDESHILGQWILKGKETKFELGVLPYAMKHGLVYCADEYDFAQPCILSTYQPVLEGKPLVIKDADLENRIIKPHPNFRFMATGNTNGAGDERGLYAGTNIQNAANYERFGIMCSMGYMKLEDEKRLIWNKSMFKNRDKNDESANEIVDNFLKFAKMIREQFDNNNLENTISPRALINCLNNLCMTGSYKDAIEYSFANRLSEIGKNEVIGIAERIFGGSN